MSAQPTIDAPTDRPRWTPVLVPSPSPGGRSARARSASASAEVLALRPTSRASAWRRRLGAVTVLVLLAFLLTVAVGRVTAGAQLADPVAGTVTIAPGETLWDVAIATAPDGVDAREQLAAIGELNGFDGSAVEPWTVVLLPAR
ncbi:MAG: hypothetical protein WEB09_05850 [Nitriliruptor sp.]